MIRQPLQPPVGQAAFKQSAWDKPAVDSTRLSLLLLNMTTMTELACLPHHLLTVATGCTHYLSPRAAFALTTMLCVLLSGFAWAQSYECSMYVPVVLLLTVTARTDCPARYAPGEHPDTPTSMVSSTVRW
jgi:hypothetical protein